MTKLADLKAEFSISNNRMKPNQINRTMGGIALALVILLGIIFRVIWLNDMEFKFDEQWTFEATQAFRETGQLPMLGMDSSAGIPNAGLSVWVFIALSQLFGATDPSALARAVQLVNITAILLLIVFIWRCIDRSHREPWLWSVALLSVNPLSVLFHRKIWPPSIFPIFTLALLWSWWYRHRRWGALLWGFFGALLGQIQLAGFFFAAGFALWALLFDRRSVCWLYWVFGSVLGSLSMVPWLIACFQSSDLDRQSDMGLLSLKFYRDWLDLSLGLDLRYSLGEDYFEFLSQPLISERPTYLVTLLHLAIIAIFVSIFLRWILKREKKSLFATDPGSPTTFTLNSAFWGYGGLITLSLVPIHLHYLIILFNLPYLGLASLAGLSKQGYFHSSRAIPRSLLSMLCACQILLTISFLSFIHSKQVIHGDYGTTFNGQRQLEDRK